MPCRMNPDAAASIEEGVGTVLLVGGSPEPSSSRLVGALAHDADRVVAVDRGLDRLLEAGVDPHVFCGDGDTASPAALDHLRALEAKCRCTVVSCDAYKDFTDLALALDIVRRRWPGAEVVLTCFGGGRPDHLLAVYGCLLRAAASARLEEDAFSGRILRAGESWKIDGAVGDAFSFVPLLPETVVSERGMEWELDHKPCEILWDLGVSNVITGDPAIIDCHGGALVAYRFNS